MENAAVVMHISADIFWKRSRKVMKKIIQILPFREFCIVISCLNMNGVIVKKGFLRNKKKRRLKDEKPVIEAFLSWLDAQTPVKGSRLDQAVIYIRNRKDSLMTYLEDGRCSLSNNLSENAIRPITVGRKNWLFCDSVDGANASAICFTMIEMAKAYDLNVYKYLNFLLEKRPNARTAQKELEKLAPWNEEVQKMFARKMK